MNQNFIEIDNELINLLQLSKIKKANTNNDEFSIILEGCGVVKTIKYTDMISRDKYYEYLKTKLVEPIIVPADILSTRTFRFFDRG